MSSQPPLSPAEQAAAEAIAAVRNENGYGGIEYFAASDWEDEARAVVAAVRGPIAAEALIDAAERVLDQADRVRVKFGSVHPSGWNRTYGLSEAASMLRADSQSLSLPASKETPDV